MTDAADYAAAGLLDGLDSEARAARVALLENLTAAGVTLTELRDAAAEDQLIFIGAERLVGGGNIYTMRTLAEESGLDVSFLAEILRASGQAVPDTDELVFGPGDLALVKVAGAYRDIPGLTDEDVLDVARTLTRGLRPVAEQMRSLALRLAITPGATEAELAERYIGVAGALTPMLEPLLGESMRLRLRDMARTEAVTAAELSAGALPGARNVGVCFADLVGFTSAGEHLGPDQVSEIARRLEEVLDRAVKPPVQMVKTLGDGAMLVSPELPELVDAALALVEAAAHDDNLPDLRAGIAYGPALSRAADWYGRPVNLASRVSDVARPRTVLAVDTVREAMRDGTFAWSFAGPRTLKGIREPVRLYRVRKPAA
jgi:adenylate cyclase